MQATLVSSFASLHIGARPQNAISFKSCVGGRPLCAPPPCRTGIVASAFVVEAKQNSLRRQRVAERARQYNKARKSEIATRMKKVFTALEAFKSSPPASEADLAPVGSLMAEAYQVIDKAVSKGVLHANTAARRKSRLARARKTVLISAGLYAPEK